MDKLDMMRVFTVVARTGGFTNAANELDIAVQTVSKYIKTLEDDLGVQLFDRTTRKVNLNNTGQAYLARCHDLLEQVEDLENSVKTHHGSPKGRIRISAPTAFGELHLVPALRDFQQEHPGILTDIDLSNRRVSLVEEGFDMAIRIGQLTDSSMIAKKLCSMRMSVCAAKSYLEKHGTPELPNELIHHNCFVDHNLRHGRHWHFRIEGIETKVSVAGNFEANSPGAIKQMVQAGLGIGLCPMYVINQEVVSGNIVTLFDSLEAYQFGVYAIYPHRKHLSTRVRVLVDFLAQRFRQMN